MSYPGVYVSAIPPKPSADTATSPSRRRGNCVCIRTRSDPERDDEVSVARTHDDRDALDRGGTLQYSPHHDLPARINPVQQRSTISHPRQPSRLSQTTPDP